MDARLAMRVLAIGVLVLSAGAAGCDPTGPVPAPATHQYLEVSAGRRHTCARDAQGVAYCWGDRRDYQLGFVADGRCPAEGCPYPMPVEGGAFSAIAAGSAHTCAVAGRRVVCWGRNQHGQLGDGGLITTPCSAAAPPLGELPTRCSPVPYLAALGYAVREITTSWNHTCAVTLHGATYCWGANEDGRVGIADTIDWSTPKLVSTDGSIASVSAGRSHTCAVNEGRRGFCWGSPWDGRLGVGAIDPDRFGPQPVAGNLEFTQITAGDVHSCAVTVDGAVYCWGLGAEGRLGTGDEGSRWTPAAVSLPAAASHVTAGGAHTCALLENGDVWCWGRNLEGQLGDGSLNNALTPMAVAFDADFAQVDAGSRHTCALTTGGLAYCWGANESDQLGTGVPGPSTEPTRVGRP